MPDIYAGILLKMQQVKEVQIDGAVHQLGAVGVVQTQLLMESLGPGSTSPELGG